MKLSVIVPIYNERLWVDAFWSGLKQAPIDRCAGIDRVEVVVVDDGSTDGTAERLEELASEPFQFACGRTADVRLIRQVKNGGKGLAVRTGIDRSTGDVVLIQDADLEYSPSDYPALLAPIVDNVADAVFGSRFIGQVRRVLYFWHSVMNRFLTLLSNMFNNVNLTDMETGYKVMRGEIARSLRLVSCRFGIEPELTARLAKAGVRLYEIPIRYQGRSYQQGKKIGIKDGFAALYHIARFGLWDTTPYKPGLLQTLTALEKVAITTYVPLLKDALKSTPRGARLRILEIGAGIGTMTETLLGRGHVVATDLAPEFVEILQQRFSVHQNFEARVWDASKAPWEGVGQFDLIVAFNILEHIQDDEKALDTWSNLLRDDGRIILLVPNLPSLYSPIDKAVGHYRRYGNRLLRERLDHAHLGVERLFFGNPLGILGWIVNGLLLRRSYLPSGQLRIYARVKGLVGWIESLVARFTGLSLIAVARRQPTARH